MTQPTPNPPTTDAPAPPGKALRVARGLIALVLLAGCVVFSVYALRDIGNNLATVQTTPTIEPKYPDRLPGDLTIAYDNQLLTLGAPGQGSYINHPPGHIPPFAGAAPYDKHPRRGPVGIDGVVTEHGHYMVPGRSPREAFDHYDLEAAKAGMKLVRRPDNLDDPRGELLALWVKDNTSFQLTVTPRIDQAQNVRPPKRAVPPLSIVVQYSYPAPKD